MASVASFLLPQFLTEILSFLQIKDVVNFMSLCKQDSKAQFRLTDRQVKDLIQKSRGKDLTISIKNFLNPHVCNSLDDMFPFSVKHLSDLHELIVHVPREISFPRHGGAVKYSVAGSSKSFQAERLLSSNQLTLSTLQSKVQINVAYKPCSVMSGVSVLSQCKACDKICGQSRSEAGFCEFCQLECCLECEKTTLLGATQCIACTFDCFSCSNCFSNTAGKFMCACDGACLPFCGSCLENGLVGTDWCERCSNEWVTGCPRAPAFRHCDYCGDPPLCASCAVGNMKECIQCHDFYHDDECAWDGGNSCTECMTFKCKGCENMHQCCDNASEIWTEFGLGCYESVCSNCIDNVKRCSKNHIVCHDCNKKWCDDSGKCGFARIAAMGFEYDGDMNCAACWAQAVDEWRQDRVEICVTVYQNKNCLRVFTLLLPANEDIYSFIDKYIKSMELSIALPRAKVTWRSNQGDFVDLDQGSTPSSLSMKVVREAGYYHVNLESDEPIAEALMLH